MTSYVEVGHARQEIASGAARNLEVSHTAPGDMYCVFLFQWDGLNFSSSENTQSLVLKI